MDVTLDDVSSVIRLVRETCERWDDPLAWREHLLRGACDLVNGHSATMLADRQHQPGWFGNVGVIALVGMPAEAKPLLQPYVSQISQRRIDDVSENEMPAMSGIFDLMKSQGWVTMAGSQTADEASGPASPTDRRLMECVDWGHYVVSIRVVDVPRRPEVINTYRPRAAQPFGPREVALLKLLHDEIAPLVGVRLATEDYVCRDGLSKRLRETLALLLDGYSEKQVASQLNLGNRTVHDYVTMLYEHFHVASRAELLAYFIRRRPVPRGLAEVQL
ncbi:MAG TPA: helix-turn-helix transcriptional regulator [Lacipirellulaceae bacterium]